jgi:hypothetical protein
VKGLTAKEIYVLETAEPPSNDDEVAESPNRDDWIEYMPICARLEKRGLLMLKEFSTSDGSYVMHFYIRTLLGVLALALQRAMDAGRILV